ncbi:MAG: prolipoprotein diacylglyceryl transferase [Acholeplasmataceae bacterium]|nr:prolipoprotein diacylglyceryl transferase [Acholeplasmataceae bacterium]
MYPFLFPEIFGYTIPMYDLLIIIGVFLMLIYVANRLEKKDNFSRQQTNKILVLIAISLVFALFFSFILDGIFHSIKEGELEFGSINFLGGLIGGFASFLFLMKHFYKDDNKDMKKIGNTVITGVVLAHAFGRIGCFCAGCCFGIPTESYLGVIFPHGHAHTLYPDVSVYPTQLFEAIFLFILFFVLIKVKSFKDKEVQIYLISYGIWRIFIEFIRGDNRGVLLPLFRTQYNIFPTPSQLMSLLMIMLGVFLVYRYHKDSKQINA